MPGQATTGGEGTGADAGTGTGTGAPGGPDSGSQNPSNPGNVSAPYVPLFAPGTTPAETIQYTEPDGTLVTLAGFRPTNRHARERGEPWADPDVGPGNYFTFPTWYFQNRTFGLMIRDGVPAGRSRIEISLRVNKGTFINTGLSAFRRDDALVREYGWKMNVGFENAREGGRNVCHDVSAREDCMVVITDNWRAPQPGTPLKTGDLIELSPAPYLDNTDGRRALIDGGGVRYYSFEQLYVVGQGMRPWYGVLPALDAAPLPDATLLGGQASVSYNYSEEPHRVFQQMANNIGIANAQLFAEGRRLFHTSFLDGTHSESPDVNPVFTEHAGQLGARYNNVRCIACHSLNGRSAPAVIGATLDTMSILTAAQGAGSHPVYGTNVQQRARDGSAPDYSVSVQSFTTSVHTLPDGEQVALRKPVYAFKGPTPENFSARQAPQVIGMGLLEAIDESTILGLADPGDKNGDGVHGIPNWTINPETGERHLGRFGWKASKASVRHQSGIALLQDIGVTSPAYKTTDCQRGVAACNTGSPATALSETALQKLSGYIALLGVPAQRSVRSGYMEGIRVSPENDVDPAQIQRGNELFAQVRCVACHIPQIQTGKNHLFAELRDQTIRPYTNLLLHDMGPGLADTLAEGEAPGRMWRTAPLWGLGSLRYVQGGQQNVRYLHDGRARTLMEAIAWHGGEADASRRSFEALGKSDRAAVLAFLESL